MQAKTKVKERKMVKKLLVFLVVFAVAACFMVPVFAGTIQRIIRIANIEGEAKVMKPDAKDWVEAKVGMVMARGYKIKTMKNSKVDLILEEEEGESLVRLKENSEITVDELTIDDMSRKQKTILDMAMGTILVQAAQLEGDSSFSVKTPAAIVGVRGTAFQLELK